MYASTVIVARDLACEKLLARAAGMDAVRKVEFAFLHGFCQIRLADFTDEAPLELQPLKKIRVPKGRGVHSLRARSRTAWKRQRPWQSR